MSYNILDAAKDFVTGHLEYAPDDKVNERLKICNDCDARLAGMCTACGCVIVVKTKLEKSECPMGLW